MMFENHTGAAINRIKAFAASITKNDIAWVKEQTGKAKPPGYDAHIQGLRHRYDGNGDGYTKERMRLRMPNSHDELVPVTTNLVRTIAANDANAYSNGVTRSIVGSDDAQTKRSSDGFGEVLKRAQIDGIMLDVDQVAQVTKLVAIHCGFDTLRDAPVLNMFWPSDVGLLCHASHPNDVAYAYLLIARVASDGPSQWYDLWVRQYTENKMGQVESWGPWQQHRVCDDGKAMHAPSAPETFYKGTILPWAFLSLEQSSASIYPAPDLDFVKLVDELNVLNSELSHILNLEAHTVKWYRGAEIEKKDIIASPGALLMLGAEGELGTLATNPRIVEMQATLEQRLRMLAVSRQQPPDAYNPSSQPLSGVSRRIANIPSDKRSKKVLSALKHFEETQLLPIIFDVYSAFGDVSLGVTDPVFQVEFTTPTEYEEPDARQRRVIEARDLGFISDARAAVECGYYKSLADAIKAGLSDTLKTVDPLAPSDNVPLFGGV